MPMVPVMFAAETELALAAMPALAALIAYGDEVMA